MRKTPITDQLESAYRKLKKSLGRPPKVQEYRKNCFTWYWLEEFYGKPGWRNFLKSMEEKHFSKYDTTSKSQLEKAYWKCKKKLGRNPIMREVGIPYTTFFHFYGPRAWNVFLISIGATATKRYNITKKDIIEAYLKLEKKLKRQPRAEEFKKLYEFKIIGRRFGYPAWKSLLAVLGKKPLKIHPPRKEKP